MATGVVTDGAIGLAEGQQAIGTIREGLWRIDYWM
jgi:hypothetical protein